MPALRQSEDSSEERSFNTTSSSTEYLVSGLNKYTSYTVRVSAGNSNGPGPRSAGRRVTTWSDVPSETPQHITVEAASDTSVVLHWEPPPPEHRNGPLTGYRIRYKVQTGGGARPHTVNGTGPYTRWHAAQAYHRLQVETTVPDKPAYLKGDEGVE